MKRIDTLIVVICVPLGLYLCGLITLFLWNNILTTLFHIPEINLLSGILISLIVNVIYYWLKVKND